MAPNNKKRSIVSFNNLPVELQEAVKIAYPEGFYDSMIRVEKPNGDFFYAVTFETEEISYLVKIDVKIDELTDEEDDKEYYDDEIKGADQIQDDEEEEERRPSPIEYDDED
ncbi:MAG: hypothetical protein IIW50_02285 [Alistipes sp.]|jgi:hypothetical protein|nr:hypothetical protein [Alistipes sp.]MBQ5854622.1 hypothetical protein [Alistipes sp.]